MSSFKLLTTRRFGPFFLVQFFGALNDNLYKNALMILIAFKVASEKESGVLINLAAGLFILPFFLFSPVAGQICDKYEKSKIMRACKVAEILIMILGAFAFITGNQILLFIGLFLMGTHSAFFGPAKYSILPQHLGETELIGGNALVEMGTFLAILLGTLAGGLMVGVSTELVAVSIIFVAVLGYLCSRYIPLAPSSGGTFKLNWNPFSESLTLFRLTRKKESVFLSIMGISWFWYFGAVLLAQLPSFTKYFLHGNESVVTMLLAVFSISIGIGSVISERLSHGEIELGLVPLGAFGMTLFGVDLYTLNYDLLVASSPTALHNIASLFASTGSRVVWHLIFDLTMIGISTSLFIVPLYAMIQSRSDASSRSRVIAANNVFNSIFMVASALVTMALLNAGLNTLDVIVITAVMNAAVCLYIFVLIPEFVMRFVIWILASTIYKIRYEGRDLLPRHGSAVIVCNHVSFIDWFIITAACRRPVRYVMDHRIFKTPMAGMFFKAAKAIPIAPAKEDAAMKEAAFDLISAALRDENIVCIFPEGLITHDGSLNPFKPGVERILARDPVPVIPMALNGLWGSFFSRQKGSAMQGMPHPSHREILVHVGAPMPSSSKAAEMERAVAALLV